MEGGRPVGPELDLKIGENEARETDAKQPYASPPGETRYAADLWEFRPEVPYLA
jgi:hypothetical protein